MRGKRKRIFLALALLSAACAAGLAARHSERAVVAPRIKIAVPDGCGGLVVHRLLRDGNSPAVEPLRILEAVQVRDCCAAVFESSLASSAVDAAIMCPEAAARLVEKDPRFEIVGPCVLNSDVVVTRSGVRPKRIGVAQRRGYQVELISSLFGPGCAVEPMVPAALPYAYEKGAVDGVLIDAMKARPLKGDRIAAAGAGDTVTYVLTVERNLKSNRVFELLMLAWEKALLELRDADAMARELEYCSGSRWTESELGEWRNTGVRFVLPRNTD